MNGDGDEPAVGKHEVLTKREHLEHAARELKRSPLFARFSRRLLFDLVELCGVQEQAVGASPFVEAAPDVLLAIVVLEGALGPDPKPARRHAIDFVLRPGVHLRSDPALRHTHPLSLGASDARRAVFVPIFASQLADAPAAAWSLDLSALQDTPRPPRGAPTEKKRFLTEAIADTRVPELIWVAASAEIQVPIDAALHILGAAIATQPREDSAARVRVLLCILGAPTKRFMWSDELHRFTPAPFEEGHLFELHENGEAIQHVQFLIGHPDDPMHWPDAVKPPRPCVHRVVHLTTELPASVPDEARALLCPKLCPSSKESIFSSYIASVLIGDDPKPPSLTDLWGAGDFKAAPLSSGAHGEPSMRPYRDSCTLRVDSQSLRRAWASWIPGGDDQFPPFIDVARQKGMRADTSGRWARTVTNRRVGVAISGGGASAYRAGPLLRRIEHAHIPIDVFAGLSGGALLGAFYCGMDPGGFDFFKQLGLFIQATMPGVVVSTWPFEVAVDVLLGWTRVEDLERRFAAIAVALPETTAPETQVVIKGTLGGAVRVSGCLPPSFAPTSKHRVRYTDGGAGSLVPAHAARHCGADVVLACNVVPGPARGNPFSALGSGPALLRWTPWIGRLIDNYTWYAYLMCQSSKAFGEHADVFVDFPPQAFPMLETVLFAGAQGIIDDAEGDGQKLDTKVEELRQAWLNLHPPPLPPEPPPPPPRPRPRRARRQQKG
jgi:predicted acylesterase/phospholipase RssA